MRGKQPWIGRWLRLLLFLSLCAYQGVVALVDYKYRIALGFTQVNDGARFSQPFGFYEGGFFNITIKALSTSSFSSHSPIAVQYCTDAEAKLFPNGLYSYCHTLCQQSVGPVDGVCSFYDFLEGPEFSLTGNITKGDFYSLWFFSCNEFDIEVEVKFFAINPGNHHLGRGYLQNLFFMRIMNWASIILFIYWCVNALQHLKSTIRVHTQIGVVVGLRTLSMFLYLTFFELKDYTGTYHMSLIGMTWFIFFFYLLLLVVIILSIAKGYCILGPELDKRTTQFIWLHSICLTISVGIYAHLQSYFIAILAISYIFTLRYYFLGIGYCSYIVKSQLEVLETLRATAAQQYSVALLMKYSLLRRFRQIMAIFVSISLLALTCTQFFKGDFLWLNFLLFIGLDFYLTASIVILFRLSTSNCVPGDPTFNPTTNFESLSSRVSSSSYGSSWSNDKWITCKITNSDGKRYKFPVVAIRQPVSLNDKKQLVIGVNVAVPAEFQDMMVEAVSARNHSLGLARSI